MKEKCIHITESSILHLTQKRTDYYTANFKLQGGLPLNTIHAFLLVFSFDPYIVNLMIDNLNIYLYLSNEP